jgi:carboxyl-terminal processing protease
MVFDAFNSRYHQLPSQHSKVLILRDSKTHSGRIRTSRAFANAIRVVQLLTAAALTACGGGGGGGGADWQQGVYLDADTFYAQCAAPRAGSSDIQGTTTDEKNFLRSYSDDTYLWYDQLPDINPDNSNTPIQYFDRLTVGPPTDNFHFTFDTEEWDQLSQSGVSAGYGAQFAVLSGTPPRQVVVAYTEPNSPATNLPIPLARGTTVLSVDGFDIDVNTQGGIDALNAGLFPAGAGEQHTFEVIDVGAANSRMVSMTSANIVSAPVQNTQVIDTAAGKVGYMLFNDHIATAEQALIDAVNQLIADAGPQGLADLVVDIRYNGGGFLAIAGQLAYMIAGDVPTAGQTFELTQFNDKHPATDPVSGRPITPLPFFDTTLGPPFNGNGGVAGQALPALDLPRVYVITGPGTCSASEAIMNSLRGVDVEVIQIGSTTCGKPYGFYPTDNCGTTYFTVQFRGVNAKNFGDYTNGFRPSAADDGMANVLGCSVADDFSRQLGEVAENRLEVALAHSAGQGCITPAAVAPELPGKPGAPLWATDGMVPKSPWQTNRIMLPPQ